MAASPWVTAVGSTEMSLSSKPYCDRAAFGRAKKEYGHLGTYESLGFKQRISNSYFRPLGTTY